MSDANPRQPMSILMAALYGLVVALMAAAIIYSLAMVMRNWSHISV